VLDGSRADARMCVRLAATAEPGGTRTVQVRSGVSMGKCVAAALALLLCCGQAVRAADAVAGQPGAGMKAKQAHAEAKWDGTSWPTDVDTEHMFGFTAGSDIGEKGDLEGEIESSAGLGKRAGRYFAASTALELKYTALQDFRIAPSVAFLRHDISGVPGLDDRRQFAFEGAGLEFKYRALNRHRAPFGLTFGALPHWARVDAISGDPTRHFGIEFTLAADKELIDDRVFTALNLYYVPGWTRLIATDEFARSALIGVAAAVNNQIRPGVFVGIETRYERTYEDVTLAAFAGEALYAGPTLYLMFPGDWNMTAAWNVQVAGRAASDGGALDLVNFERHQFRLRFGTALN
jgi:hypothetical protein